MITEGPPARMPAKFCLKKSGLNGILIRGLVIFPRIFPVVGGKLKANDGGI